MKHSLFPLSLGATLLASAAFAAPATQQGADDLTAVFQSYLGTTAGVVTVQPTGESYAVKLDLGALASKIPAEAGASFVLSPLDLQLVDNGDGTWGVSYDQAVSLNLSIPNAMDISMSIGNAKGQGTFDTALKAFATSSADTTDFAVVENIVDPAMGTANVSYHIDQAHWESSATAGNAGANVTMNALMTGLTESFTVLSPDLPMDISLAAETYALDANITDYRTDKVLELVAFFVANPSQEAVVGQQAAFKEILSAGLPLFEHMTMNGQLANVTAATPMGPASAAALGVEFEANGIVSDGMVREAFNVSGLTLPEGLVPEWAKDLVPHGLTIDFKLSRFDLATPVKLALEVLDLAANPPIPDEKGPELLALLLPEGVADITIAPGATDAPAYQLTYEGVLTTGPETMPTGKASISLTGMEAIQAALQSAPPEIAGQAMMGVGLISGMGRPGANGELIWDLEATSDGKVLINGVDMSMMMGGQ
ncbi:MAG: DUF2125 domain-containing protein [Paracoccaceae bacterium]